MLNALFTCSESKFETPRYRILPSRCISARAQTASSIEPGEAFSGAPFQAGQWTWYRSTCSTPSRFKLPSSSRRIDAACRLCEIRPDSSQTRLHLVNIGAVGHILEATSDNHLRMPESIHRRRIDPVQSSFEAFINSTQGIVVVLRTPAPLPFTASHRPCPNPDWTDTQVASSKLSQIHAYAILP